jgi:hypothetical protein
MALKKDKQKVLDEQIDADRLTEFLDLQPPAGISADYHILERAYRGMQAHDFERFIDLFVEKGHDLNVSGPQGTLLEVIRQHSNGEPYARCLEKAGAS